jgi:glycosyltransferase involved in cell wall biosynthesis
VRAVAVPGFAGTGRVVRITFILWDGNIGGAERVTVALAGQLRRMEVETCVLFVGDVDRLAPQLSSQHVPYQSLGLGRGASVVTHPMRLRKMIRRLRPDVVIAGTVGYLGAAVRATGFRGPLVGVEHGQLIEICDRGRLRHPKGWLDRLSGVATYDAEVAVSRYMLNLATRGPHARRVLLIPHGVNTDAAPPSIPPLAAQELIVGYAGRLFPGKGVDRLITAVSILANRDPGSRVSVQVAGDGEMRRKWERLAQTLGIGDRVRFLGWTDDVVGHWARCHVAVAPNDRFVESFNVSVAEAMAAGRPTIVTDRGALPELVLAQSTGTVVPAADDRALADALAAYACDPDRVHAEGAAARRRATENYSLTQSAQRYLALADELVAALRSGRVVRRARPPG